MTKIIAPAYFLLIVCAAGVRADDKPDNELPARVASHHRIMLGEVRLDYEAVAETLPVIDTKGATTASTFTTSYLADAGTGNQRPGSFAFNGAPGARFGFLLLCPPWPRLLGT